MRPIKPIVFNVIEPQATVTELRAVKPSSVLPTIVVSIAGFLILFLVVHLINRRIDINPSPVDPSRSDVVEFVDTATRQYAANLGDAMTRLSEDVRGGRIKTSEQLRNNARAYTEAARVDAFGQIDRLDQSRLAFRPICLKILSGWASSNSIKLYAF